MDKFTQAYIECALWSSTDDSGTPLDKDHTPSDIAESTLATMVKDCASFQAANADLLSQVSDSIPADYAGHDFWLTRNRHGAGFWDRGLGEIGRKLTEASHTYGSFDLYVGDDGQIHGQ